MAKELLDIRYRKLLKHMAAGRSCPQESLTEEESRFVASVASSADAYCKFKACLTQGQLAKLDLEAKPAAEPEAPRNRQTLRFLKPVPSIIGSDMKTYGPFAVEDVAAVPIENARILIKQGMAKPVEVP
jgi:DNA replication initiation complex subunit (GINS family)